MLDYKKPFHVIEIDDDDCCFPQLSFSTLDEANEFVQFSQKHNLVVVKTKELKNYYDGLEYNKRIKKPGINQPGSNVY